MNVRDHANDTTPDHPDVAADLAPASRRRWTEWLLIFASILPFQIIFLAPALRDGPPPTGFILYDMPYYVANGREVFERGNGLMYPNPYDCSEDAPVIYFHWLLWVFGFCTVKLGIDPGLLFAITGFLGSVLMAWMTWKLVKSMLPDPRWRKTLFLLTMWGGGFLCLGKLGYNVFTGQAPLHDILGFDTHSGFWFFSWGRNTIYATEAMYHFLAIGAWYFAFHKKYWRSVLLAGLLGATHPWSGLEVLGTFAAFLGFRALVLHTRSAWRVSVTAMLMLCGFFAYNLWYLNLYEAHRVLYEVWHINWSLTPATILLAYVPIGFFALRAISDQAGSNATIDSKKTADHDLTSPANLPTEWQAFLMTAFVCAFLLATHDRFVEHAKQPLHFTRGFIWMPLCLLALPHLQRMLSRRPKWNARPILVAALLLLFVSFDNLVFLSQTTYRFWNNAWDVQTMTADARDAFDWMDDQRLTGVLACSNDVTGYLSATYTGLNPYIGHQFNTPDLDERRQQLADWFSGQEDDHLEQIVDYALIEKPSDASAKPLADHGWPVVYENDEYVLIANGDRNLATTTPTP